MRRGYDVACRVGCYSPQFSIFISLLKLLEYLVLSKSFSILILDLLTLIDIRTFDATFIYDPNILKVSV